MKATEAGLLKFLEKSPRFVIPIYQRTYSWTERECRQLWDDIIRAGQNDEIDAHFVGSVVYIEEGDFQVMGHEPLLVIDGQQRLTTVTLLLEALARHVGDTEPVEGFSAEKIRNYYLQNALEKGDKRYKLLLTQTDKDSLVALVQGKELPDQHSLRIEQNFDYFNGRIDSLGDDLEALCAGLSKLVLVDVALNRSQDNPQLIFESMNSTGKELSQADLIRNFVLMGLEPDHQATLYKEHWRPMEVNFGQEAYGAHFDRFMRYYLTLKTGEMPNVSAVYEAFKSHSREPGVASSGVDALVADIHAFSGYYCAMALGAEPEKELAEAFQDLRELKVEVAYPLLLEMYSDYASGTLPCEDFVEGVRLIESYVFRRAACSIPTNSLNKTFASFARGLKKDRYLESVQAAFLLLPSYRRFPLDEEFQRDLTARDLYNFQRRSYWLRRIENHGRKERVAVDEYTIEHIMPQNDDLSREWQDALGPDWRRVHETQLHTLGNLTLTGYNSEYGDRPFAEKRDMAIGGFRSSPLQLNKGLGELDTWDEAAIQERGKRLAEVATAVWQAPSLADGVLEEYRPSKAEPTSAYSIDDHDHLAVGTDTRALFDVLRKEILSLDPCVVEEYLKLYVAYKAETNFVDIVPQAKRLRLSLNLPFYELHDPRGIAKDVTDVGRWGNGDVEVRLDSLDDLPYVMGLVRQSFEKQMGSTNGDV